MGTPGRTLNTSLFNAVAGSQQASFSYCVLHGCDAMERRWGVHCLDRPLTFQLVLVNFQAFQREASRKVMLAAH